jgi:glycosyltransferase involved in cell wall biosynthesis
VSHVLRSAVVTPAHDELTNLRTLADCMLSQTTAPAEWVIVDDGSTDGTRDVARRLADAHEWIRLLAIEPGESHVRGGPIVRSFTAGVRALETTPDVIVKIDADVSFEPDYFERLLLAFAENPQLGISSGVCHESENGKWAPIFGTRSHVWGATRSYRRACLDEVMPLEEREGWDELDALAARLAGWETLLVPDLPFRHNRKMGERDGSRTVWLRQGESAYYMGYRPSYLLARTAYRVLREPQAAMMLVGWAGAALRRKPRLPDGRIRGYLRDQQRIRNLPLRARETRGIV